MIYAIIGISLIFVVIAYALTANNAKQMLSGYNTMSTEEQRKFDIETYIPFFKKFHIALGVSFLILGLLLTFLLNEKTASAFIGIYPIAAYIYFIKKSSTFYDGKIKRLDKFVQIFLMAILIFIITMVLLKELN